MPTFLPQSLTKFQSNCICSSEDEKFNRRDRYHNGPTNEFKEKDNYKPNVKLEYIDDSGRLLNEKEAFRYLSHKFHGKGPSKNKIEKRLKKNEQDGVSAVLLWIHEQKKQFSEFVHNFLIHCSI